MIKLGKYSGHGIHGGKCEHNSKNKFWKYCSSFFPIFLQDPRIEKKQTQVFRGQKLVGYNFRALFLGTLTWVNSLLTPLHGNYGRHGEHDGHWQGKLGGYSGHTW